MERRARARQPSPRPGRHPERGHVRRSAPPPHRHARVAPARGQHVRRVGRAQRLAWVWLGTREAFARAAVAASCGMWWTHTHKPTSRAVLGWSRATRILCCEQCEATPTLQRTEGRGVGHARAHVFAWRRARVQADLHACARGSAQPPAPCPGVYAVVHSSHVLEARAERSCHLGSHHTVQGPAEAANATPGTQSCGPG